MRKKLLRWVYGPLCGISLILGLAAFGGSKGHEIGSGYREHKLEVEHGFHVPETNTSWLLYPCVGVLLVFAARKKFKSL
jgi:hypothetical protein